MLNKLLKYDLKKNMHWMWILFASTIAVAGISRGFKEFGESIAFFSILGIFFESLYYTLAINSIIQPFLRSFLNFSKSLYSDESYLTHTLPVTKKQIINSKYLTAIIETCLGFLCVITSLLINFAEPNMFNTLELVFSTLITGEISVFLVISLIVILIIVEFLMYISIIFFSVVIAYRSKEKRVLKAFLLTVGISFAFGAILSFIMVIVLLINKVDIMSSTITLSNTIFLSIMIAGILVYSFAILLCYFLTQKEFAKGVNVD